MWVIVKSISPKWWDDGVEQVIGPFPTKEAAESFADQNIVSSAWEVFNLTDPTK